MFKITRKETTWGGRKLVLESGRIARQADGAVLATMGETVVLATAVAAKSVKPGQGFFPLTVNYQEKAFAAGKIPGGFFKREGRPDREGDADLAPDRPPDPAAVPGRVQERDPGRHHRAGPRRRQRPRHPGHGRGLGGADHQRRAVPGPDRGGPRRLHERRVHPQPDHRADPRERPRPGRRRHARRRDDGRVRGQGALRGDHAGRGGVRPQPVPAGDRPDHRSGPGLRQGALEPPGGRPRRAQDRDEAGARGRAARGLRRAR